MTNANNHVEGLSLVSCRTRWQQNRLDVEAGRPLTFVLTPAQIAAAKSPIQEESLGRSLFRSVLPMSTGIDVKPGESEPVIFIGGRMSEFPHRVIFGNQVADRFEVDHVSLGMPGGLLRSRDRGDRMDLASIEDTLCRIVVPAYVDLTLIVRNIDSSPHPFMYGILSSHSAVERRADLLRNCSPDRRPLAHAWWWDREHQYIVNLPEEKAREFDATLGLCADGSPRRDFRAARVR